MMAFFLLLWLISMTTPEQKKGLADYFAPASISETTSGAGGVLAGTAFDAKGAKTSASDSAKSPGLAQTRTEGLATLDDGDGSAGHGERSRSGQERSRDEYPVRLPGRVRRRGRQHPAGLAGDARTLPTSRTSSGLR